MRLLILLLQPSMSVIFTPHSGIENGEQTMFYQFQDERASVTIERDGADWRAMVRLKPSIDLRYGETHTRYFTAHDSAPDGGLLRVINSLRREFGIVGTYHRVDQAPA